MIGSMARLPGPSLSLVRQNTARGCSAKRLAVEACLWATIDRKEASQSAVKVVGKPRRSTPFKPIQSPVTTPLEATPSFNYEQALHACAAGGSAALQSLYQYEARYLLGVALRIVRQRQMAEDVVHDAFMNIWNKAASFDAVRGSGRAWIYSVTRNLAFNAVRQGAREVSVDEETAEALEVESAVQAHAGASDAFELQASMGKLHDCLERLEPARRNCILYAYVDGYSHGEIAERTQTPLGTVKAWIKRGMGTLRECMT